MFKNRDQFDADYYNLFLKTQLEIFAAAFMP